VALLELDQPLPNTLLDGEVKDDKGAPRRLREYLGGASTLLVFLRHFGCIGCSQQVDAIAPRLDDLVAAGLRIVLVGNGDPKYIPGFVERQRLTGYPVTVVTDPSLCAHRAAGFGRSVWASIGPRALWSDVRAYCRGYFGSGAQGDLWQQGGILLVDADAKLAFRAASRVAPDPVAIDTIVDAVVKQLARSARAGGKTLA